MADLSREDVLHILDLIDKSPFDFFELQMGDVKLTVSKTGLVPGGSGDSARALAAETPAPAPPALAARSPAPPAAAETVVGLPTSMRAEPGVAAGLTPVSAPIVGTFYAQPEPGAPPYVEVGSRVEEDTTMGLIEVMKVFNAVRAGACGVVAEILVQNAQFVEFGQTLFLLRPETSEA